MAKVGKAVKGMTTQQILDFESQGAIQLEGESLGAGEIRVNRSQGLSYMMPALHYDSPCVKTTAHDTCIGNFYMCPVQTCPYVCMPTDGMFNAS